MFDQHEIDLSTPLRLRTSFLFPLQSPIASAEVRPPVFLEEVDKMIQDRSSVRVAICYGMCALAFCPGCAGEKTGSSGEKSNGEQLLRVVEQVYDDRWRVIEEIMVQRGGTYQMTVYHIFQTKPRTETVDGHLPDPLMQALRADIVNKTGFQIVASVPTYTFGIDDNHVRHPAGIAYLLDLVAAEEQRSGNH
jgi:hypothetical protein